MNKFVLTCCSTADMTKEYFEKRQIPCVCYHFTMDGAAYLDDFGQSISFEEFYSRMAKGSMPTTSQVNVSEFVEFFETFLKEGKDVLHISFSSGLSGTYNSACIARNQLAEQYPERTIEEVDSLAASTGYGLLVDEAADRRDRGDSLEEVKEWVEENKLRIHHWFFSTDLTSFKRGGRISPTAAMLGTVLNICPLMNVDKEGHLVPRQKIRTKKKAMQEAVHMMELYAENGTAYSGKCYMCCSACYEDAKALAALVEERFPALKGKIMINSIGTVIGSHTGPGTVALFFMGSKRTD